MHSRVPLRLLGLVVVVGVGMAVALPAMANTETPPFEFTFPQDVEPTEFTSTFGDHRSGGRAHLGNDLLAPRMTEVYAFGGGMISYVGTNNLSGRNVKIDHGGGWETYYLHLNNDDVGTDNGAAPWTLTVAPGIEEGMNVDVGQLIGWVGDSGNAETTTPHTHFELRLDGRAIDPHSILVGSYLEAIEREEGIAQSLLRFPDYEIE